MKNVEIVLDCIVERKKTPDLAASILDSRYNEQKGRIIESGLFRRVYLVEGDIRSQDQMPVEAMLTAMARTECVHGFLVHNTSSVDGTITFLAQLHQFLQTECKRAGPPAPSDPIHRAYDDFEALSKKSSDMSTGFMFTKQLCMIKGVSADKALAIATLYPTAARLRQAYATCANTMAAAALLSQTVSWGPARKKLPMSLSQNIHAFFTLAVYNS